MEIGKYPSIEILIFENNICIKDSYTIVDDKAKKEVLGIIKMAFPDYPRSIKSMLREWKVHNAFYQRGWFKKSTKDTDLEANQTFIVRLSYLIASIFIKERRIKDDETK